MTAAVPVGETDRFLCTGYCLPSQSIVILRRIGTSERARAGGRGQGTGDRGQGARGSR